MAVTRTPWLGSFTLTDSNAHKLRDLLTSTTYIAAALQPRVPGNGTALKAQYLVITNDIDNGSAKLYVGNESLSTSFYGIKLVASMSIPLYSMEGNLINLDEIYILTDTNPTVVSVSFLTR